MLLLLLLLLLLSWEERGGGSVVGLIGVIGVVVGMVVGVVVGVVGADEMDEFFLVNAVIDTEAVASPPGNMALVRASSRTSS